MTLPELQTAAQRIALPQTAAATGPMLLALTAALNVPRTVLAGDDQIEHAWNNLPRLLDRIPTEHRSETLVWMCVAVATGLFDSAINYAWNASVIELREKVRRFGLHVVPQVTNKPFDEQNLVELKDAELLDLCLKLNLISEEGFFLLDQCRDVRNNFSAAHPTMGSLDETEFLAFLNRCGRHALSNERNPRGVDIQALLVAIKGPKFSESQLGTWAERLSQTFDAQRELLVGTLHGVYCDPASGQEARNNAIWICERVAGQFTPSIESKLVDRHQDYQAKGDEPRHKASLAFFEYLKLLSLLNQSELHALITTACRNLLSVHDGYNNFYNEPPFSDRLASITAGVKIPDSAQNDYVTAVVTCATGNPWGTSGAAMVDYSKMISSFSPAEIRLMLHLPKTNQTVARRISSHARCKTQFASLVRLIESASVPTGARADYDTWMRVAV